MRDRKGSYVKRTPQTPEIGRDKQGQYPGAVPYDKPKEKGGTTPYFFKPYLKDSGTQSYLATLEAVSAHLMRLVFGPEFTPKVRVVASAINAPQTISRKINLAPATQIPPELVLKIDKRSLARLPLSVLLFEEPDLHHKNWGLDCTTKRVAVIDHDRKFSAFAERFQSDDIKLSCETDIQTLMRFPNLVYHVAEFFGIVSPDDIRTLPKFQDAKPYNHPFTGMDGFDGLHQNAEFIQWKFFYCTKYILLLTKERIGMIINSHSVGSDETDQALCEYIFNRVEKIKEILFLMPEYQAFFRDMPELLMSELYADIEHYNAEFCAKTGTVKPHKAHFVITLPEVNAGIAHLMQAMQSAIQADTPERAARRIITLNMQRISRELRAIDTFTVALQQETKRCSTLLADANHPRAKMPITSPILHALRELCHSHLYNDYLKKNLRATGAEFLRFVVKHSQEKLQPTLKTRQEQARQCIHTTLESLFLTHGKMLSSQDLQDIWLYGNKDPVIRQTTLVHMLQYCRFEYIPTDILQWFYALPQQITGVSHQFSNFHALSRLITTLNTAMHLPEQNSSQPPRFLQALRATQTRYTTHLLLQLLQTAEHQICIPLETLKQLDTGLKGALSAQLQIMDVTKCLAEAVQKTQGEHSTYRLSLLVHEGQATLTCVQQVRPAHAVRATTSPILRLPILIPRMPPPPTPPAPPSRTPRIPPIPPSQRRPYALR